MPQILHQDDQSTTILDDAGNVAVIPRGLTGTGGAPVDQAGPFDHLAGMVGQVNGAPPAVGLGPGGAPGVGDLAQAGIAPPPITTTPGFPAPALPPLGGAPMGPGAEPDMTAPPPRPQAPPAPGPAVTSMPQATAGPAPVAPPAPGSPDAFAQAEGAYGMAVTDQQRAVQDQARVEAQREAEQATILQRGNEERDRLAAEQQAKRDKDAAQLADLSQKHESAIKQWADTKIDDNHFYASRSTGQNIAIAISLALSGLGEALQGRGGKNPALDIINKYASDDVNAQLRERDNARDKATMAGSAVDRFRAIMGDNEGARQALLAAAKQRTADQIEQAAKAFGSPLAIARGQEAAAALRTSAAEHQAQATQAAWSRGQQQRQLDEQIASRKASIGVQYANLRQSNNHFYASLADHAIDRATSLAMDAAKTGATVGAAKTKAEQDQQKELAARAIGGSPTLLVDDKGQPIVDKSGAPRVTYQPLKQADGSVFMPDEKTADKLREMKTSADVINQFVGDITRGIAEHGGESSYVKSADWQRTKAQLGAVRQEMRAAYKMGALDEGAMKAIDELLGGADPTSFMHDATPGLVAARDGVNTVLISSLRNAGYTGDYRPTDTTSPSERQQSGADAGTRELLTRVPGSGYLTGKDAETAAQIANALGMPTTEIAAAQRGYDANQEAYVNNAANIAASPSSPESARQDALRILETVQSSATSHQLRVLAADTLKRVQAGAWRQVEAHDPTAAAAAEVARRAREAAGYETPKFY